jgi:hypothetical protein
LSAGTLRGGSIDAMRRARADDLAVRRAMAVVIAAEWVENLARLTSGFEDRLHAAAEAARIHWWP